MRSAKQGNYLKTRTTTRTRFVHAWEPTVILAGKSDSHRHSTLSFRNLEIRNFIIYRDRAIRPSTEIGELTFVMKKYNMMLPGVLFFRR